MLPKDTKHSTNNDPNFYTGTGNSDFFTLGDNDVASVSDAGIVRLRYAVGSTPAANSQSTTAGRTYGVTKNANDQLIVNVPWTDSSALTEDQEEENNPEPIRRCHSSHTIGCKGFNVWYQ